jgi:hypothetical protein
MHAPRRRPDVAARGGRTDGRAPGTSRLAAPRALRFSASRSVDAALCRRS